MSYIRKKTNKIEGRVKYVEKLDPWSTHTKISSYLKSLPSSTRILDVGCATGTIAKLCLNCGLIFYGVEENPEWAKIAMPYYQEVFVGKLEKVADSFLSSHDVIILADILEHIPECEKVLDKLYQLQKNRCTFIISVPNIANLWVRINLLFGKFDYAERGIMDKTHVKFFTYMSFKQFLRHGGLEIFSIDVTPVPLGLISGFFVDNKFGKFIYNILNKITRIFPKLLGYQFIAFSKK